jgi:Tfp pilus assembly protein PilV
MFTDQKSSSNRTSYRIRASVRRRTQARAAGRPSNEGLTLIEVIVAFTVLIIALIPLSYLFTTALIQAGQSANEQTALSLAEKWTEVLANQSPPTNNLGEVAVNQNAAPEGPITTATTATVTITQTNPTVAGNLPTYTGPASVAVTSGTPATFVAASVSNPQSAYLITPDSSQEIEFFYTGSTATTFSGITGWYAGTSISPDTTDPTVSIPISSPATVVGFQVPTSTVSKGGATYSLQAEYQWTTSQDVNIGSATIASGSNGVALPPSSGIINLSSTTGFAAASGVGTSPGPQKVDITTSTGVQVVTYTGISGSTLTGASGGTGTMSTGGTVVQDVDKPDLCTAGSPQLLELTMTIGWGPNANTPNDSVQDSIILNYPPAGIQTLGFIALQFTGDTTALDSQSDPWSERVRAPQVTVAGPQNLTLQPDSSGCVFAQVKPSTVGNTYTVTVNDAVNNTPYSTTYGPPAPSFVANGSGTTVVSGTLQTSPATTITVGSTAGFPSSGPIVIGGGTNTTYEATCTGSTATTFTGCTLASGGPVTLTSGEPVSEVSGGVVQQPTQEQQSAIAVSVGAVTNLTALYPTAYPAYDQGSQISLSYPSSSAVEDGVSCPGDTSLTCVSTGENGSGAVVNSANQTNWSTASIPSAAGTVTRIASVACAGTVECVGVGYGGGKGVILDQSGTTGTLSVPSDATALTGVTSLTQVVCPSSSDCVAIGTTATGAAVLNDAISGGVDTWTAVGLPANVTGLSQLACPTGGTGCVAIGTTSSPSAGTPIIVSGGYTGTWTASTSTGPTYSLSLLVSVACPSATSCVFSGAGKIGSASAGPIVVAGTTTNMATSALSVGYDSFPSGTTVTSVTGLNCPSSSECLVLGTTASGPFVMWVGTASGSTLTTESLPTVAGAAMSSLTQIACPSASACVLIGAAGSASAPAILSGALSGGAGDSWTSATVPAVSGTGITLGQVTCASATACVVSGVGTSSTTSQPSAFLWGSSGGTLTADWQSVTLPASNPALYLSGISCTTSGSPTYCSAVGASATGAVVLSSNGGPTGSWAAQTPANLSGSFVLGVPIEANNSNLSPYPSATVVPAGASTDVTSIPDIYPFSSGYSLLAGDCYAAPELGAGSFNVAQAATVPGDVPPASASVTIPLGMIEVRVLHSTGNQVGFPYNGATFSLTSTAAAPCGTDTYTLPAAGPDGLSRTAVPYGTYTLTITTSASTTTVPNVTVGGSSITVGGTTYLPPNPITDSVA